MATKKSKKSVKKGLVKKAQAAKDFAKEKLAKKKPAQKELPAQELATKEPANAELAKKAEKGEVDAVMLLEERKHDRQVKDLRFKLFGV